MQHLASTSVSASTTSSKAGTSAVDDDNEETTGEPDAKQIIADNYPVLHYWPNNDFYMILAQRQ